MPAFTVTTFTALAGLLVAARRLATGPDPIDRIKALADLAGNGTALAAALRDAGLTPLAAEMARRAREAEHFTHPGSARDDAKALFWQVAPAAIADTAALAAADLDPRAATDRMVATIKASAHGPDFTVTVLAEPYFRAVMTPTLEVMLARPEVIASLTPDLWHETLARHGIQIALLESVKDDTAETLALVRELHATMVPESTLIAIARKIRPRVADRDEALRELENAANIAAAMLARGHVGSNVDVFVDAVLRRLAELTEAGDLDAAAAEADAAVDRAEAGLAQLIDAAINQHLLAYDAEGAARQIVRRITLDTTDTTGSFEALRNEQDHYYQRGRNKGLRLDLEVAIALARAALARALVPSERGKTLNNLGCSLAILGERESGTKRLLEAVAVHRAALEERSRERDPLDWATSQNNLGVALQDLAVREQSVARVQEAIAAFRRALEVRDPELQPYGWAEAKMNLGNSYRTLGERHQNPEWLEGAIDEYCEALTVWTRDRAPADWAMAQNNLGSALWSLGTLTLDTTPLKEAVSAYQAALEMRTREEFPLDWAMTQMNLGAALSMIGQLEQDPETLQQSISACRAALQERTRERVPLDWAKVQMNLAASLAKLAELTGVSKDDALAAIEAALEVFRAAGADAYVAQAEAMRRSIAGD